MIIQFVIHRVFWNIIALTICLLAHKWVKVHANLLEMVEFSHYFITSLSIFT